MAPVESVFGYETKYYRLVQRLEKSHANDAVAMVAGEGKLAPEVTNDQHPELVVEPLRRRVRKLFNRHRRINRGVAVVDEGGKRRRIKVVGRGECSYSDRGTCGTGECDPARWGEKVKALLGR